MNPIPFVNVSDVSVLGLVHKFTIKIVSPISIRTEQIPKQNIDCFYFHVSLICNTHLMWFKSVHRFSYKHTHARARARTKFSCSTICWHLKPHKLSYLLPCFAPADCVSGFSIHCRFFKPKADNVNTCNKIQ